MTVITVDDDPNGPLPADQNKVTLRDAIQTGNNGGGILHLTNITFYSAPNTPLAGAIILKAKQLDAIKKDYNIVGPGAAKLTVNGNFNSSTIFTVNAGVTSTISGLEITGGSANNGGGIMNSGDLTLSGLTIDDNEAVNGSGGGVFNTGAGAALQLQGVVVYENAASTGGGLGNNGGNVTITGGSVFTDSSISKATITLPRVL